MKTQLLRTKIAEKGEGHEKKKLHILQVDFALKVLEKLLT